MSITEKVALVTGASRGIGYAIALRLGELGAVVIGTATTANGAEAITRQFEEKGINGHGLVLDVANPESITDLFKQLQKQWGAPDIVVNNAGITRDNLAMRMGENEWGQVIATNLTGLFLTSKAALRGMLKKRWGRIINISSVVGAMGNSGQTNYAAAKAGIEGFTRSLAREVASRGVTVNAVAPGFVETDMTDQLPEEQRTLLKTQIPLGRLGRPEDIADLVGFLAGEGSGYITGETIHVNGGMYMS